MSTLAIRAIGLSTPLGGGVQACAAARAGISRPGPAPDVTVMFPGDEEPQPVTVHAHPTATQGFTGAGRLIALLQEALIDLVYSVPATTWASRTRLFLALPDPLWREPETLDEGERELPAEERIAALGQKVVKGVCAATGLPLQQLTPSFHGGDELAFSHALVAAARALEARQLETALVCAADSLVGADTLELFAAEGRLKHGDQPVGFTPGEAAGAVLLTAPARGQASFTVAPPAIAVDAWRWGAEAPSDGRKLAGCLVSAAAAVPPNMPLALVSDCDGETHRARELGLARVHLKRRHPGLAESEVRYPALAFARTGVASGLLGLAAARHALWREKSAPRHFIVASSADDGKRSAFLVTRTTA
ncbi:MAG: hypothetical protein QM767_15970 [Anaeromyxobacter sp.]